MKLLILTLGALLIIGTVALIALGMLARDVYLWFTDGPARLE